MVIPLQMAAALPARPPLAGGQTGAAGGVRWRGACKENARGTHGPPASYQRRAERATAGGYPLITAGCCKNEGAAGLALDRKRATVRELAELGCASNPASTP